MNKNILLILSVIAVLFIGCGDKTTKNNTNDESSSILSMDTKSVFNLTTYEGHPIQIVKDKDKWTIKGYEGKVILLDFWATWCPPCKAEVPHLNNLYKKYNGKFKIIGILMEEDKSNRDVNMFAKAYGVQYDIVNSSVNQEVAEAIGGVGSIPAMFLINTEGKIVNHYLGVVPEEMMDIDIKKAFKLDKK